MTHPPPLDRTPLRAGMRVAVAISGGADSVGLLRSLAEAAPHIGLVLSAIHVHHGIRGTAADEDAQFVAGLAAHLGLTCRCHSVDAPATARLRRQSLEEAARELRYAWFRSLLADGYADAVATAHTLDDQAETVLHRLIRGAWTEGLSGIHSIVTCPGGAILRPFLATRRAEIVEWLRELNQPWREDATNADTAFTRNRIRHELLPQLSQFNPRIAEQLAHLAILARDEESWWSAELQRLLPSLLLPGRPARGGGRAVSTHPEEGSVGVELERLRGLAAAVRRRVLRAAAQQLGCMLNFEQTERLMEMCAPHGSRRQALTAELRAERTPRELRLLRETVRQEGKTQPLDIELPVPGEAAGFGVRLRTRLRAENGARLAPAILRAPRPGDRARLRYSRGSRPLKEIFERMHVDAAARQAWPVVAWEGQIVWMRGIEIDPDPAIPFLLEAVESGGG